MSDQKRDKDEMAQEMIRWSNIVIEDVVKQTLQNTKIDPENIPMLFTTALIGTLVALSNHKSDFGTRTAQRCVFSLVTSLQMNGIKIDATVAKLDQQAGEDSVLTMGNGQQVGRA